MIIFDRKLNSEVNKLKEKYKEKKKKLADKRAEYEEHLKSAMKETRIRDSMASKPEGKYSEISLSEIDAEGIAKENEERLKLTEKNEQEKKKLKEEYEGKIKKVECELEALSSRSESRVFDALQTFVDILTLELDKLLKHFNAKNKENASSNEDINTTIAKLIVTITADGKCGVLLQNFKIKLNNVLGAFKNAIEEKYKKPNAKAPENKQQKEHFAEEPNPDSKAAKELKKYIEVMDQDYEKNILNKISPIRNNNGKYVVDVEKVVRDLLLVKEALYSVFHKGSNPEEKEDTNLAILNELTRIQTMNESTQSAIDGIAKQYRILLNTILRYAVEAAWVVGQENNGEKGVSNMAVEQEEVLRLKLIISELKEQLINSGKEKEELDKKLALFVGENSGYVS